MELTINNKNLDLTNENIARITQKTRRMFNKVSDKIQKINVTLNDVNGPKGGKDKRCQVVIQTVGMSDVVINDSQTSIGSAVSIALSRARITLIRKIKNKQKNMPVFIEKAPS